MEERVLLMCMGVVLAAAVEAAYRAIAAYVTAARAAILVHNWRVVVSCLNVYVATLLSSLSLHLL